MDHHVLIEHADDATRDVMANVLRRAGFEVSTCAGPARMPDHRCSLVSAGTCELAARADVVVCGLNLDAPDTRDVLVAHRTHSVGTPVIIEATASKAAQHAGEVEGAYRLPLPCSRESLVDAVRAVMVDG